MIPVSQRDGCRVRLRCYRSPVAHPRDTFAELATDSAHSSPPHRADSSAHPRFDLLEPGVELLKQRLGYILADAVAACVFRRT